MCRAKSSLQRWAIPSAFSVSARAVASAGNAPTGMPDMYLNMIIETCVVGSTRENSIACSSSIFQSGCPIAHLAVARIAVAKARGEVGEDVALGGIAAGQID